MAGAKQAAEGLEAEGVVRELVRSRGEKPIVPVNLEQLIARETQVLTLPGKKAAT